MRYFFIFSGILFFIFSCSENHTNSGTLFQKVPSHLSGITFKNSLEDTPELNILTYLYYYNGAGIAAADFNQDGLIDLYFTSNQNGDKLYLNKGEFKFEDISKKAGIDNEDGWTTGVTHTDINNDGLLDIYVCKVSGYLGLEGHNLLYVNQGNDKNGQPIFKEDARTYGLNFSGLSTQSAFFDYDRDGDLDMYLLNHSVHPNRAYGKGSRRMQFDGLSGDRFYKNENGKFVDISADAGIFQGAIGYGLGLGISDLNNDGYPDIYVGNDFFENDYLYINKRDGSFEEIISKNKNRMGHTSHFSMGNDLADINNDGRIDIVSMDMLPENVESYKTSGLEYAYPIYQNYLYNGYAPQYMQNNFHLNLGNANFAEIGNLAGISATEWSWGALLADYDNDGLKDLFISNGIKGATNDMDFINFIANNNIQKRIAKGLSKEDMALITEMPKKKISNYFFKNSGNLTLKNVTEEWFGTTPSYSNGSTYADLDNDGDLDIVVNNIDEEVHLLKNTSREKQNGNFLTVSFKGSDNNRSGIGCKVILYTRNLTSVLENFSSRGYLSAVPPKMHFGIGQDSIIDSLKVIWPNGKYQNLLAVSGNQDLELSHKNARDSFKPEHQKKHSYYLKNTIDFLGFRHNDNHTLAFDRNPLIPYANTNKGPSISISGSDRNGSENIFIGGAKGQASQLLVQDDHHNFYPQQSALFEEDAINEDVTHDFFDADGDGDQDLIVASGGDEFKSGSALRPRFYRNNGGRYEKDKTNFLDLSTNASKIKAIDFDSDGDLDIALASDQVPHCFGKTPRQYLLQNDGHGNFTDVTDIVADNFKDIGNVTDFSWVDLDGNGHQDLIAVGRWMPISIFMNDGKIIRLQTDNDLFRTNGWWNVVVTDDFDNDGDIDFVAGNWGDNSKLHASLEKPITLYRNDFDDNGTIESVVTHFHTDKETPFASKDELVKQLPYLNKEFLSYSDFARASLDDLFSSKKLKVSKKKMAYELKSAYFENLGNGKFSKLALPNIAQASTIHDIAIDDFNSDGFKDLLIVGNTHEISTQLGRMDASHGLILLNDGTGAFTWASHQNFDVPGAARSIAKIRIGRKEHFIIGINNDVPIFLTKE